MLGRLSLVGVLCSGFLWVCPPLGFRLLSGLPARPSKFFPDSFIFSFIVMIIKANFGKKLVSGRKVSNEVRPEWLGWCKDCPYLGLCDEDCGRLGFPIDVSREPKKFSLWLRQ